jgi:hypothetical protein
MAKATAPLAEIKQPLVIDLKEALLEGMQPQLLDDELNKLGYEMQFYQITAFDALSGRAKKLFDNFGEKFEIWKLGQKPTDDEDIFFRGATGIFDKRKHK